MNPRRLSSVAVLVGLVVATSYTGTSLSHAARPAAAHSHVAKRHALLHPSHKYYGLAESGGPYALNTFKSVGSKVGKQAKLLGYFKDWTHPFQVGINQKLCDAGVTPYMTWESWSWENKQNGSPAFSQPKYAPRRIANGFRGAYVRRTANQIKQLHCTLMLRFDHEMNGTWYPWGIKTAGMHNKARDDVKMWRHVWRVFHRQHVHNVIWVWSPNYLLSHGLGNLRALYPGNKYVDMVGIDGYLIFKGDNPKKVFGPIMHKLSHIARHKPWFLAETGAPNDGKQPGRIRMLLHKVATSKKLVAFVYLDEPGSRANWRFSNKPSSVSAFRAGIHQRAYGG